MSATNFVAAVKDDGKIYMPFRGTRAECQAWIDEQAARACFESVLPVSDAVVEAMMTHGAKTGGGWRDQFTAAIRHITTGGDDAGK